MARKTNTNINGNEYYRVTRTVGHKADGTPIKKQFYGSGIKEAEEKANEYINKLKNGYSNDFDKVSVVELMQKWLFTIKLTQLKPSAFVSYECNYRLYIATSPIASLKLADVKKIQIQEYYNSLFENGKSTEKIKMINKVLHNFFEYALDEGYIVKNPCHKIIIPKDNCQKTEVKDIPIFSPEEIESIKKAFIGNKYENIIYTAIYTGMREGEILALKWKNLNLDKGYIYIEESLKTGAIFDSKGNKEYKTLTLDPKSKKSIRHVYIPEILINKLKSIEHTSDYIFTNDGKPVTHKSLYSQWTKVLKKAQIPYKKFHALRHTYASTLLTNGVDIKTVQELMGHYDISITQVYLHSLPDNKKKAVSIFDK